MKILKIVAAFTVFVEIVSTLQLILPKLALESALVLLES